MYGQRDKGQLHNQDVYYIIFFVQIRRRRYNKNASNKVVKLLYIQWSAGEWAGGSSC